MLPSQAPLASWETFAPSWDKGMGDEGNDYFRFLELPILEKLVDRSQGSHALDLATGNGLVARWLAEKSDSVIATDGAVAMIEYAKARADSTQHADKISFHHLDVTSESSWNAFMAMNPSYTVSLYPTTDEHESNCTKFADAPSRITGSISSR